jgi:hypothetical protein
MTLAIPRRLRKPASFAAHIAVGLALGIVVGDVAVEPLAAMAPPTAPPVCGAPIFLPLSSTSMGRATTRILQASRNRALEADPCSGRRFFSLSGAAHGFKKGRRRPLPSRARAAGRKPRSGVTANRKSSAGASSPLRLRIVVHKRLRPAGMWIAGTTRRPALTPNARRSNLKPAFPRLSVRAGRLRAQGRRPEARNPRLPSWGFRFAQAAQPAADGLSGRPGLPPCLRF